MQMRGFAGIAVLIFLMRPFLKAIKCDTYIVRSVTLLFPEQWFFVRSAESVFGHIFLIVLKYRKKEAGMEVDEIIA